jgi:hypothetical protein
MLKKPHDNYLCNEQPLAMAMAKLRKTGQALALQMTENWHREYQVGLRVGGSFYLRMRD